MIPFSAAILALLSSGLQGLPTPSPTPLSFGTTANIVRVDVVATDGRRKKTVSDLRAEEFEIAFDGRRFAPSLVEFVPTVGIGAPAAQAAGVARGRAIAFLTAFPIIAGLRGGSNVERCMFQVQRASGMLNALIAEQKPTDRVAIIRGDDPVPVLLFTHDPERLRSDVQQIRMRWPERTGDPIMIMSSDDRGGMIAYGTRLVELAEQVIRALSGWTGQRMLFLVSDGFPSGYPRPNADKDLRERVRALADLANLHHVTIFGINPEGAGGFADGLEFLAERTGGQTVQNTTRLKENLREILAASEGYYLLGFEPASAGLRFPQKIGVRVHRKGVRVRVRQEVFAEGAK